MADKTPGQVAYEAYNQRRTAKNWHRLNLITVQRWERAAQAVQAAPELRPVEHIALTTAKTIAQRGDLTGANTVLMLCLVIERLAGMGDYLIDAEPGEVRR